jgi:nitrous oxide reductase accessory protein NosL
MLLPAGGNGFKVMGKMMPRFTILVVCLFSFVFLLHSAPGVFAEEAREGCRLCGMWIDQYIHTRHVLTAGDGTQISFCSFACAAKFLKRQETKPKRLQVADYLTAELVDVEDAFYLQGSDATPVMSYLSIIAFADIEAAENFQKLHGGRIMTFAEVLAQH